MFALLYVYPGSSQLTQAVEHTGKTYEDIGEMIAEQVCKKNDEMKPLLWLAVLYNQIQYLYECTITHWPVVHGDSKR